MSKYTKNFLALLFSNVISQLCVFLAMSYYAKKLGSTGLGDLSTVQAIITYFTMIVFFGLQTFGTREIAKNRGNIKFIVGDILAFRILIFILCFFVISIMAMIFKFQYNDNSTYCLLLLYGATLLPSAISIDWVFSGTQEMEHNAVYSVIKAMLPYVLLLLLLKNKNEAYLVPLFTLIALIAGGIYQFFIYFIKDKYSIKINLNKNKMIQYVKFGMPFLVSGILAMINGNVDRIVIKFARGSAEAGIYASGYNIIYFLTNIITMIFTPVFPIIINCYNNRDAEGMKKVMKMLSKIITALAFPLVLGGIILSKQLILLIFDNTYLSAYMPFSILLLYIFILFFREIYGYGLNACGREKKYLKAVTVSALVNLIFNLILTPKYGMNIAALITVVSEIINIIMMRYYAKDVIIVSNMDNVKKIILPSLLMAIITLSLLHYNVNVVLNILLSAAVYVLVILKTKYITLEEIKSFLFRKSDNI